MPELRAYVNNAATSFPKPPAVVAAVTDALLSPPADGGRGGSGVDGSLAVRRAAQRLLGVAEPEQVILLASGTEALNLAILGNLKPGDRVVGSTWSHNSVSRPLAHAARNLALKVDRFDPMDSSGQGMQALSTSLSHGASLVVMPVGCNVTGAVTDFLAVAEEVARHGATLVLDASQAAGCIALEHRGLKGRVFLALSGHKALCGPAGTGLLVVPDAEGTPIRFGGTGVRSKDELQPPVLPCRYEAGTPNLPGAAGLAAGLGYVLAEGVEKLSAHRAHCVELARQRLEHVPGVSLLPRVQPNGALGIVSFTVTGWDATDFSGALFSGFGIESRGGLQCAPNVHRKFGTFPAGAVRLSFGPFTTERDVCYVCDSVARLAEPRDRAFGTLE